MRARAGDAPILLLDDVLSELDAERAGGFLAAVGTFEQAFLTTTEVPSHFGAGALFRIAAARVERVLTKLGTALSGWRPSAGPPGDPLATIRAAWAGIVGR